MPGHLVHASGLIAEHLGDARVHPRASALGHRGVRRVADECVREPEAVHAELPDEPRLQRRVETVEHLVLVGVQDARERGGVEVPAHHARHSQGGGRGFRQAAEAPGQDVLHGGRRVLLRQQGGQVAALACESGVLDEEERVAVGAGAQRVGFVHGRGRGRHGGHDLSGLCGAESRELEPQGVPAGEHLGELGQLSCRRRLVSPGRDHHQPAGLGSLRQQPQHPQGRGVGPVQVVEDHEQVLLGRGVEHRARDRLPGPEAGGAVTVPLTGSRSTGGRGRARAARWPTDRAVARPRPGCSGRPPRSLLLLWPSRRARRTVGSCRCRARP